MGSSRSHRRHRRNLALAAALLLAAAAMFAAPSSICGSAHASDIYPVDYCYVTNISITNSGTALTNYPVRVEMPADGLIAQDRLDSRAWDLHPAIGSFANEIHLTAQDLSSNTSPWWLVVPTIGAGESRTALLYSGSAEQRRDQGIYFTGNEQVIISDHADFDITDNLIIDVALTNWSDTARTEGIVDHRETLTSTGYQVYFVDVAGTLTLRIALDADVCQIAWDPTWTGQKQSFRFEYISGVGIDTWIYRNGSVAQSCDLDEGTLSYTPVDVYIGTTDGGRDLASTQIFDVAIFSAGTIVGHWGFDGDSMAETVSSNPYQGTIADYSGNSHTATYTFDRDQTGLTAVVNTTQLVSAAGQLVGISQDVAAILGEPFGLTQQSELQDGIFYNTFLEEWVDSSPVRSFGYVTILSAFGLLFAVLVYKFTRYIPLSLFVFGIPLAAGVGNGWVSPWWMVLWIVFAIGGWWAQRLSETS